MSKKERIDLAVMVLGFCLIGFVFKTHVVIWIALGIGCLSFLIPIVGKKVVAIWLLISKAIGFVMSRILLSLVFYLVLFPVSLLYKGSTKNPLNIRFRSGGSLFKERNHTYGPADLENPW